MKKYISAQFKKGFTILEMLMVLAIFTIITSVVISNYGEFNSKTILSNMAYEVALSIRQAQVYSLSVRGDVGVSNFDNHYGIYLNTADNKTLAFFIDRVEGDSDPNGVCDSGGEGNCLSCIAGSECLEKITLTRDITVASICIGSVDGFIDMNTGTCLGEEVNDLTLTFARPNPDAIVITDSGPASGAVAIVLQTSYGNQRAVIVKPTGQISVETLNNISE